MGLNNREVTYVMTSLTYKYDEVSVNVTQLNNGVLDTGFETIAEHESPVIQEAYFRKMSQAE